MSVACAVLMCHAPIVIPQIAGTRGKACATTTSSMRKAARALCAHEPDLVVLVSPHAPRQRTRWGLAYDPHIEGSFARFGHHGIALSFTGAPEAARAIAQAAAAEGLSTAPSVTGQDLDHGALVPLYFLHEAGYAGRVLLVALPYPGTDTEPRFGAAVRAASEALGERWAVLASGDMSHRLTEDAPSGYDALGVEFDRAFVSHLTRGDLRSALAVPEELADRAAEDVLQSTAVAAGAVDFDSRGSRVFSYEGPFGVGYCEALLYSAQGAGRDESTELPSFAGPPRALADLALDAITHHLRGEPLPPARLEPPWDAPRAVFVTLRSDTGELRGCIGRTAPVYPSLVEEIVDCAIAAATRDHRVPPISADELPTLRVEVSVLSTPEPVESESALDPARYGVVLSQGTRRGVLLPAIDGVDSVDEQLRIALRKGGIDPRVPYRIERFRVDKVEREP